MTDALTLLPPVIAILIAAIWRNVFAALIVALILAETLIVAGNPALGALGGIDRLVATVASAGNAQIFLFCIIIGALIALMRDSGGVAAMARQMLGSAFARTRRRAELAVTGLGTAIFIETNVSLLATGVLGRPLYDAHRLSRARLAYVIDTTSAPVSVLILLNAWGAYALGLLEPYGFDNPVGIVGGSVAYNFYALLALLILYVTVISGRTFGPLRAADRAAAAEAATTAADTAAPGRAIYMWLPLTVMIGAALAFMWWTGEGDIRQGDGGRAILWAIVLATAVAALLLRLVGAMKWDAIQSKSFAGMGEMLPVVAILLLSIALGASLRTLGTGAYVAELATGNLPAAMIPVLLFLTGAVISFMTGTSWGTYGILVPIAMPVAQALGIPPSLALGAVLGGGVFGDHCSPISDTTIIASVAAGCDHLEHVKTQLPYALVAAALAALGYYGLGLLTL